MADDELGELLDFEFNMDGGDPVAVSGGTTATEVCKNDFDFPLKDTDIPAVVEPKFIEDKDECLSNYEDHISKVMAGIRLKLDKFVLFNKTMDVPVLTFLYNIHYLAIFRYWKYKRTGNYDTYSFDQITGTGALPVAINQILTNFKGLLPNNTLPKTYTIFDYQANLTDYFQSISGRVTYSTKLDKIISVLDTQNYANERGMVKNILESINGVRTNLNVNFSRSVEIGLFSATKNLLPLTDKFGAELVAGIKDFISTVNDISMFFTQEDAQDYVIKRMKEVQVCGTDIDIPPAQTFEDTGDDPGYKGDDQSDTEDMLKLKYWMKYASRLNVIALIPKYWTKGLILPKGLQKVPIVWQPLLVIPSKTKISVLFLTINGMIVFPVMWELRMNENNLPVKDGLEGDNSYLKVGIRGANKKIKGNTGSKVIESLYVEAIDAAPSVTKAAPIIVDDLPQWKRVTLSNIPFVSYLNDWAAAAADIMGIQP